jgi:hypothetical protein
MNRNIKWVFLLNIPWVAVTTAPAADSTVVASDLPVYVTRQDCLQLVAHHADASVAYQPGVDVHGHYVAPADLPSDTNFKLLPDRVTFDIKVNPLAYAGPQNSANSSNFANTNLPIAKVEVDLLSGGVRVNGQSLDGDQSKIVMEACQKAGYRRLDK